MIEVDIRTYPRVNGVYLNVPQPMVVYHSSNELIDREKGDFRTLNSGKELIDLVYSVEKNFSLIDDNHHIFFKERYFLATKEVFIPERILPDGQIVYKVVNGCLAKTDNCYIQLFAVKKFRGGIFLYTSSGVHYTGIFNELRISAGIKHTFQDVGTGCKAPGQMTVNPAKNKILNGKKPSVAEHRFLQYLLNPLSKHFMDMGGAANEAFGSLLSLEEKKRYSKSDKFKELLIKELSKMIPNFKEVLQKKISPEKVGDFLTQIMETAIEKGTTDDQLKAMDSILNLAYSDELSGSKFDAPLISDNGNKKLEPYIEPTFPAIKSSEVEVIKEVKPDMKEYVIKPYTPNEVETETEEEPREKSMFVNDFEEI